MTSRRNPGKSGARHHEPSAKAQSPKIIFETTTPYDAYVRASTLAELQQTKTDVPGEYMFLVCSQIMELYFNLINFEWRHAQQALRKDDLGEALVTLRRSVDHFTALNASWVSFRWMTPADFNAFRDDLGEASGFQSFLYRHMEFLLGFKDEALMRPHKNVAGDHYAQLQEAFIAPCLYDDALAYLARHGYEVPADVLQRDTSLTYDTNEHVEDLWVALYADTRHGDRLRDLAEVLTDIAEAFSDWRYRHVMAVRRAMGAKGGSGGSAGLAWLERSLARNAFPELWSARTRI
ncbi:MAG: tryptophan 2,3-dioxygenase family protein [Candidatus Nanopelagicales bacterium]